MSTYLNIHNQLEIKREQAKVSGLCGPRIMVVGQQDAGKSTLVRILLNYAARMERTPLLVDIDIEQGDATYPAAICATTIDASSITIESGYKLTAPLMHFYGHTDPSSNPTLFKEKLKALQESIEVRLGNSAASRTGGVIINTCSWMEGAGYDILIETMNVLNVDGVIVIGNERLHAQLKGVASERVTFAKLPRSGGAVGRSIAVRGMRRYMYCDLCTLPLSFLLLMLITNHY
jgi:polyribonucleotide 5'-hydroxyl-kinase